MFVIAAEAIASLLEFGKLLLGARGATREEDSHASSGLAKPHVSRVLSRRARREVPSEGIDPPDLPWLTAVAILVTARWMPITGPVRDPPGLGKKTRLANLAEAGDVERG
jgi:hypothetical protein